MTAYDYSVVQLLHGATYEVGDIAVNGAMLEALGGGQLDNICDNAVNKKGGTDGKKLFKSLMESLRVQQISMKIR